MWKISKHLPSKSHQFNKKIRFRNQKQWAPTIAVDINLQNNKNKTKMEWNTVKDTVGFIMGCWFQTTTGLLKTSKTKKYSWHLKNLRRATITLGFENPWDSAKHKVLSSACKKRETEMMKHFINTGKTTAVFVFKNLQL